MTQKGRYMPDLAPIPIQNHASDSTPRTPPPFPLGAFAFPIGKP